MDSNVLSRVMRSASGVALIWGMAGASASAQSAADRPAPAATPQTPAPAQANTSADARTAPVEPQPASVSQDDPSAEIVVTGFRASLDSALSQKRSETAAIDSIVAEDLGKFPDANLAESMQRVPGVALARGDGGEGRNITVRGLSGGFVRVRLNGMEGSSNTGASDIYGAGNTGRTFDFNAFPTEIFSRLTVRKTPSADVEEGSLGATVDLVAPRPLDQKESFVFTATGRLTYSELAREADPRASALISKSFADGRFGVLASIAYQNRHLREVGYSAGDILSANTNGGFCSPVGFSPQNPANNASKGTTVANCSTGNPRTSSLASYQTLFNARRPGQEAVAGSGAFLPRLPRFQNSEQQQERIGGTFTVQFKPDDATDISLDLLYSRFDVERDDSYIEAVSFARTASNNGQPMTSIRDLQLNEQGSLVYGLFDGVDVRSEGLHSEFTSTFKQANLNFDHRFSDSFKITALAGLNRSEFLDNVRLQHFVDAIDVDGFSIDFRDGARRPTMGFGFDVSNPANFAYAPAQADGTVLGGFSLQSKPSRTRTDALTADVSLDYTVAPYLTLRGGASYRVTERQSIDSRIYTADTLVRALPAGTSVSDISTQVTGVDDLYGRGAPASWAILDWRKLVETFDLFNVRRCTIECGSGRPTIKEDISAAYAMANFDVTDLLGVGLRGDVGVRYVHTNQNSSGFISRSLASSPTGVTGQYSTIVRSYDDWLPSANVVVEPVKDLLFRFSAAKVMSRPDVGSLAPTSGVNGVTRNGTINNPLLDPVRANTLDAAVEWYFQRGGLLSAAFFYKDIKTFVQRLTENVPFSDLGLPAELLVGTGSSTSDLFSVSRPVNTPGGPLKGVEVNAQVPLTFLPGPLKNLGVLANYTYVKARIEYILSSTGGVASATTTNDLTGLSRHTASGTLYYEDDAFSIRTTANYRNAFLRAIPASAGSDIQGNDGTIYVDASASLNITPAIKLIVEAQNLTDERNSLYIDSSRRDPLYDTRVGRTFAVGVNARF